MVAEPVTSTPTSPIPSTVVLTGEDPVTAIAVSTDGTRVATGSMADAEWAGAVHIWDTLTGEPLLEIDVAGSWDVAFSPDGQSVAARLVDPDGLQSTSFWSVADGTASEPFVTPWDSPDYLADVDDRIFPSPDGKTAVRVGRFAAPEVIDAATGAKIRTLPGSGTSYVADYDSDGSIVAVKFDQSVRLWRLDPFQELSGFILPKYDSTAERMEFTPDGTRLVFTVENNVFIVRVDEQGTTRQLTGRPKDN